MGKLLQISLINSLPEGYVSAGSVTSCSDDLPESARMSVVQKTQNKKEPK